MNGSGAPGAGGGGAQSRLTVGLNRLAGEEVEAAFGEVLVYILWGFKKKGSIWPFRNKLLDKQ